MEQVIKDESGRVLELQVSYHQLAECARKPRAFIHWVSRPQQCEVRLYNKLFNHSETDQHMESVSDINQHSVKVMEGALINRTPAMDTPLSLFQFERLGYFCMDPSSDTDKLVFNRTVTLKENSSNPVPIITTH